MSIVHLEIVLGSLISLLLDTTLGIPFRSCPVALWAYFIITFLVPTVLGLLATNEPGAPGPSPIEPSARVLTRKHAICDPAEG